MMEAESNTTEYILQLHILTYPVLQRITRQRLNEHERPSSVLHQLVDVCVQNPQSPSSRRENNPRSATQILSRYDVKHSETQWN